MINPQTVVQASLNKDAKDRVDILERAFARLDWEVSHRGGGLFLAGRGGLFF